MHNHVHLKHPLLVLSAKPSTSTNPPTSTNSSSQPCSAKPSTSTKPSSQPCSAPANNATNMVKAMADGNYVHIRCMAHTLHLVVTAALKECWGVTNVILIARKITGFVHRSNKAVNKLHKIQEELGLPKNTLVHDV
ncbi:zinc finger BED domain-containing protein 4-like isoform X1 [Tachysurus ichikawai]